MTDPHLEPVDLGEGVCAVLTRGWAPDGSGSGFNLSAAVGDGPDVERTRMGVVEDWIGAPVVTARQVHGADVHVCGSVDDAVTADALVATDPGHAVAVLVADCVPVLLADGRAGVVAAVHAGRRGVVAGVVGAAVVEMTARGARPELLRAVIGPAICGACYEVPEHLQAEVARTVPVAASTTSWGTPALDLPTAVRSQLEASGVHRIASSQVCTREDPGWFSHRASAIGRPSGRFAAAIRVRPAPARPGVSPPGVQAAGLA